MWICIFCRTGYSTDLYSEKASIYYLLLMQCKNIPTVEMHLARLHEDLEKCQKLLQFKGLSKNCLFCFLLIFLFKKIHFKIGKYILNLKFWLFKNLVTVNFSVFESFKSVKNVWAVLNVWIFRGANIN